jgi:hypothetical protein
VLSTLSLAHLVQAKPRFQIAQAALGKYGKKAVFRQFTGENPEKNKTTKVIISVVLDSQQKIAWLGRYENRSLKKKIYLEGADCLSMGAETGTWSYLLQPKMSNLADYALIIVETCNFLTLSKEHLKRLAGEAHWVIHVRELSLSEDGTMEKRCRKRNFGNGQLTSVENGWLNCYNNKREELRKRFDGLNHKVSSLNEIMLEELDLIISRYK